MARLELGSRCAKKGVVPNPGIDKGHRDGKGQLSFLSRCPFHLWEGVMKKFYFRCPTCETLREIKISHREKPFLRCDLCGGLFFWNLPEGIRRLRERVIELPDPKGQEVRS